MATFVVLAGFTEQGIRNVKETVTRAEAFKDLAKKSGVTVKDMYWTLGRHDVVALCEAPDDETVTALHVERFLPRLRPLRDVARLLVRRNDEGPRQDGLIRRLPEARADQWVP